MIAKNDMWIIIGGGDFFEGTVDMFEDCFGGFSSYANDFVSGLERFVEDERKKSSVDLSLEVRPMTQEEQAKRRNRS